jgi:hexosaminidase
VDGRPYGAPAHRTLAADLALDVPHLLDPDPAARYLATVARPVTGGVQPTGDYHDGRWLAWEGADATVTLDLGEARPVQRVTARCLHAGGRLIHAPERVTVEVSPDGRRWWALGTPARARISPRVMARVLADYAVAAPIPEPARWVRLHLEARRDAPDWPWAPGYPPWIFLGQVAVE